MMFRLVLILLLPLWLFAQDRSPEVRPRRVTPSLSPRRLALVIGNKSYDRSPLVNPINDARAVAAALADAGFARDDIRLVLDAKSGDLRRSVREFVESVGRGDLAFVYYSGHGVEVKGMNYLLPTDLPPGATESWVQDESVQAQHLLQDLDDRGALVRVMILDACRDNPLRGARSGAGGLAAMEGRGSLIVFSTEARQIASDDVGQGTSVFTAQLVQGLRRRGVSLDVAMKDVSRNVARATGNRQVPAIYGLLLEDVVLSPGGSTAPPAADRSSPDAAAEGWRLVKDSADPRDFEDFIAAFPTSDFTGVARLRLAQLRRPAAVAAAPQQGGASRIMVGTIEADIAGCHHEGSAAVCDIGLRNRGDDFTCRIIANSPPNRSRAIADSGQVHDALQVNLADQTYYNYVEMRLPLNVRIVYRVTFPNVAGDEKKFALIELFVAEVRNGQVSDLSLIRFADVPVPGGSAGALTPALKR